MEEVKLTLEEKEQEIEKIKKELAATSLELKELTEKEEILEKKIIGLLGKLDVLQGGISVQDYSEKTSIPEKDSPKISVAPLAEKETVPVEEPENDVIVIEDEIDDKAFDEELIIETVDSGKTAISEEEDDDIIIIDDEDEIEEKISSKGKSRIPEEDDEIILLDDDDEIVIDDVDGSDVIIDRDRKKTGSKIDDDDDIIIIEDDDK